MSTIHNLLNALLYLPETEPMRRKAQVAVQLFKDLTSSSSVATRQSELVRLRSLLQTFFLFCHNFLVFIVC